MLLAIWAGFASSPGARGQGREGAGYWTVVSWVSSDHGLLDAPEEAHGKDHEEKLQRKGEGEPESGWVYTQGSPNTLPERIFDTAQGKQVLTIHLRRGGGGFGKQAICLNSSNLHFLGQQSL